MMELKWSTVNSVQDCREGTEVIDVPGGMVMRACSWNEDGAVIALALVFIPNASVAKLKAMHTGRKSLSERLAMEAER